jgi:hypothetical protein
MLCFTWYLNHVHAPLVLGRAHNQGLVIAPRNIVRLGFGRALNYRFSQGIYRHDQDREVELLRETAQMLVELHALTTGAPVKEVAINPNSMFQQEPVEDGFYTRKCPTISAQRGGERGFAVLD